VTFLDLIILPLWETWGELVYPDAQDMLDNLSKTREFWHDQMKGPSPPLSENEPEGDDPGNDEEHPVEEGASAEVVVAPKAISEESSMNCSHENQFQTCPVDGEDTDTCSLQSSTDSLANLKRYGIVWEREGRERERGRGGEREREERIVYTLSTYFIVVYSCRISFKHIKGTKIGQEVPQDDDELIIPASSNTI
jgi:hypothetical protein